MTELRRGDVSADSQARLQVIYARVQQSFGQNLTTLGAAVSHLAHDALDGVERRAAECAAHRLVGAAETVGFPEATAPARRLEEAFARSDLRPDRASALGAEVAVLRRILVAPERRTA